MSTKLKLVTTQNGKPYMYVFWCPGCNCSHGFKTKETTDNLHHQWKWNGDMEKPTVTPSIGTFMDLPNQRCHLFMKNGQLQFLSDSFHFLAGQTIDMVDVEGRPDIA